MTCSWQRLAKWLASAWVVGTILICANACTAEDDLPPARQLIAETLALCNADRENNVAALNEIAAAQCYLGDFDSAQKNLLPYKPDDFFQQAAHQTCAAIEVELRGSTAAVPAALWNDGFGFMHGDAAAAFVERGEIEKAIHHISEIPTSVHSAFNVSGRKLIQKLKEGGKHDACRKVVRTWASCYEKSDSIFHYRDRHGVPQLVAWLVEFDERMVALSLCDRWHTILQAENDIDECGEFIGRTWAEYALALHSLGNKKAAGSALDQAFEWMNKARTSKLDPEMRVRYFDFASSYAAIAARRAVILGAEEALPVYNETYNLARLAVNADYGEYVFARIVEEQLTAGDMNGVQETIKRMSEARSIAKSWQSICEHDLARRKTDSARAAARAAVEVLDRDGFEPFMAQDMAPVAAAAAHAGEMELARKVFQRALTLSEANESPKFNHPWIAGIQVHAGLLSDAYRTIQSVEEASDRTLPLAKLCRALAKAEYEAKKPANRKSR